MEENRKDRDTEETKKEEVEETEILEIDSAIKETEILKSEPRVEETTIKALYKAYLLCIDGPLLGQKYPVRFDITKIGRDEEYNDIALERDRKASRRHATIISRGGEYVIYDKRSRNRTYVNRTKLGEDDRVVIHTGDEIEIGSSIFRFIKEDAEDFAPPRKAGAFWLRWKLPILRVSSVIIIMILLYFSYRMFSAISIINQKPSPLVVKETAKKKSDLRIGKDFDRFYSTLAMVRIPKQNVNSVVVCVDNAISVLNGATLGRVLFIKSDLVDKTKGITLADLNQDGVKDLIVISQNSKVEVYDCLQGLIIWTSEFLGGDLLSPLVSDINDDGYLDLIIGSKDGKVHFGYLKPNEHVFECVDLGSFFASSGCLGDVDADGHEEVVIASKEGVIYIIDAATAQLEAQVDAAVALTRATGVRPEIIEFLSSPVVGQLNTQEGDEIVVVSRHGFAIAFSSVTGEILWHHSLFRAFGPVKHLYSKYASPVLVDLDSDNILDVVIAGLNGYLTAIKGTDGSILWSRALDDDEVVVATPGIVDINKDGISDVICGTVPSGIVYVLDGNTGEFLFKSSATDDAITSSPIIGDVNGDYTIDLVIIDNDGQIVSFGTNAKVRRNEIMWETVGANAARVHAPYHITRCTASFYYRFLIFGIVFIAVMVINLVFSIKQRIRAQRFRS